jgi:Calcineurin-like phosphoesterase/Putative Ig domain
MPDIVFTRFGNVFTALFFAVWLGMAPTSHAQTSTTATSGTAIIKSGDVWEYWDRGTVPPTSATWATGRSPFGYQPSISSYPITTSVVSTSVAAGRATVFFRKTIPLPTNPSATYFVLRYRRDDGISIRLKSGYSVYEILRDNLLSGPMSVSTSAREAVTTIDSNWYSVLLPGDVFSENVLRCDPSRYVSISAEVHQQKGDDTDLFFDLELTQYRLPTTGLPTATSIPVKSGDTWEAQWFTIWYSLFAPGCFPSDLKSLLSNNRVCPPSEENWRVLRATGSPERISYGYPGDSNKLFTVFDLIEKDENIPLVAVNNTTYNITPAPIAKPFGNVTDASYLATPPILRTSDDIDAIIFRKKVLIPDMKQWASFNLKTKGSCYFYINDRLAYLGGIYDSVSKNEALINWEGAFIGSPNLPHPSPLPTTLFKEGLNEISSVCVSSYRGMAFNLELTGNPVGSYAPVANRVQSQTAFIGQLLNYTIPAFGDNNLDSLTYKLTGSLPASLSFNAITRAITGTPSATGITSLTISATDPGGLTAATGFTITVFDPPKLLRGPYLQNATTSGMTFRFRTDVPCIGRVLWGNPYTGNGYTDEDSARVDHVVSLSVISPNFIFSYTIGCNNGTILDNNPANTFRASPLPGSTTTRIWALGDFGIGTTRQTNVRKGFEKYVNSIGDPYINLWLWLGDNSYEGTDTEYQKYVFSRDSVASPFAYGNSRFMRQTPIYAVPGNHDYLGGETRTTHKIPYFDMISPPINGEAGGVASGKKEYYSFDYNNIHFVALDSYGFEPETGHQRIFDPNGPQVTWLKKDLEAAQKNTSTKWIVCFWHHPPYSRGTHNTDTATDLIEIRQNLIPILEQYKVDLVLNGHSHVYERSGLMRDLIGDGSTYNLATNRPADAANAKATGKFDGSANSCFYYKNSRATQNEGIVYVVNGAGGAGGNSQANWPHPAMVTANNAKGSSMYLEVQGGRLDAKAIDEDGQIIDQFTIFKDICPPTLPQGITCTCGGKILTPPPALSLLTPGFDCKTGSLTFVTAGGDGTKIEYQITGQTNWTIANTTQIANVTALVNSITATTPATLTLLARQSSTTVSYGFDVKTACLGSGREGVNTTDELQITVFGNPTTDPTVDVEIRGAEGQQLRVQLADSQGKIWTNHNIKSARVVERQTVVLGQSAGVYLLTVSSGTRRETMKIVRE